MTSREKEVYARGKSLFERGDVEPALTELNQLLETRNGFADVHYMVGVLLDRQGDLEGAASRLRDAVHLNPAYAEALLALACVYARLGDYPRSRELAERASTLTQSGAGSLDATTRGKLANLQAAVADAYAEVGDLREAVEGYRKALERCPNFHDIRYRLGIALREVGLPDQALREFKRVLRGNPGLLDAQVQLGLTYYTLGRATDALERWRAVLSHDPDREDARMYTRLVRSKIQEAEPDAAQPNAAESGHAATQAAVLPGNAGEDVDESNMPVDTLASLSRQDEER
jgi:tetratricopeptide (TPR) repeat protein